MKRLVVDGMHGSIARKLRIFGFDTVYFPRSHDKEILEEASSQKRVLVTSDQLLHRSALKNQIDSVLLRPTKTEEENFARILKAMGIDKCPAEPVISHCPICNGELVKDDFKTREVVFSNGKNRAQKQIYKCQTCGKEYWEGSHWKSIRKFSKNVNSILSFGIEAQRLDGMTANPWKRRRCQTSTKQMGSYS
jgi:uncharacterized protein with PIN domain